MCSSAIFINQLRRLIFSVKRVPFDVLKRLPLNGISDRFTGHASLCFKGGKPLSEKSRFFGQSQNQLGYMFWEIVFYGTVLERFICRSRFSFSWVRFVSGSTFDGMASMDAM